MTKPLLLDGGEYDVARKEFLRAELDETEPHSDVVLDLAKTDYIDCSCVGVLIAKLRDWRARDPDTHIRLRNVAPGTARMLGLLELDRLFVIENIRTSS